MVSTLGEREESESQVGTHIQTYHEKVLTIQVEHHRGIYIIATLKISATRKR